MRLAKDNDVVQALAPDRSDQPLGKAILPGRGWCNWLISDAHGAKSACDNGAVNPIAVPDHVARSSFQGYASVIWRATHSAAGSSRGNILALGCVSRTRSVAQKWSVSVWGVYECGLFKRSFRFSPIIRPIYLFK